MSQQRVKSYKQVTALMKARGFSQSAIDAIHVAMVQDALQNSDYLKADRSYTAMAYAMWSAIGLEPEKIMAVMQELDRILGQIADGQLEWDVLMGNLERETGIVVHAGDNERFAFEYMEKGEAEC